METDWINTVFFLLKVDRVQNERYPEDNVDDWTGLAINTQQKQQGKY